MAEESAVKVCVRIRPLIEREEKATTDSSQPPQVYWKAEEKSICQIDDGNPTKSFTFDRVFNAKETTNQLYQDIAKPLVVSTVEGYNGTIFAYGQTSSGKTFTMMGSDLIPGVIPLAMTEVFEAIKTFPQKEFLLRVSYMEIYNETVTDLLVDRGQRKPLEVRETINKSVYVADLEEKLVTSPAQALAWIRKGEKNRHYEKTKMNQRSSRSHTIFRMILESREKSDPASGENADGAIIVSHLNLVDLAGSERASQTGAEGARFKEGCNINRSLFVLGQVIKKLSEESQRGFTNYRDSKLTRILQNSLGGNAKTVIICTITPAAIEETLGTLQFASTARNMKNDPHVTEVSDDGALLKRYRNEILDLKRRLLEVSTVTHNTVTEKETLSQLLQEKAQLQREQEDRIKNLTELLVTSSDFVTIKRNPKRRMTWGGKLLRFAEHVEHDAGKSDSSFAEPFQKRRKADLSNLTELGEDDEDLESNWEYSDVGFNMEMRNSEDSRSSMSPFGQMSELSEKMSHLEQQLETEIRQKEEAATKVDALDRRVEELTLQLETEAQQKQQATEKTEMLETRLPELEGKLAEHMQMKKEFGELIQLCEVLDSKKRTLANERDYLEQELGIFREQVETLEKRIESLEKEKTALSCELEERREIDEFKSLEESCRREDEKELQKEISSLKDNIKTSERKCQKLEDNLEATSEELKKKSDWAEELQSLSDMDLAQQVKQLHRSLDDAEGLSRETKKEWAFLRSENIALKERDTELTATYKKMEAEVNSLRFNLEAEKSRFKKMQTDLQRELQVAFDENTKLTTLMDGKVPKNLIDRVELERTVSELKKELATSREEEGALQHQLEELKSLQGLPDKVDDLMKQVCALTEELGAVQTQKDSLFSAQVHSEEHAQQLKDTLQISRDEMAKLQEELITAEQREQELTQRCTEQLDKLHLDLESSTSGKNQLLAAVEEMSLRYKETDQQRASFEEKLNEMQQLFKDLEEKLADSELSRSTEEEIGKELQEQLNQLTEDLERVQAERDHLLSEKTDTQDSAEELEKLLSKVTCLSEERDQLQEIMEGLRRERNQLKEQLDENMEMAQIERNEQQPLNSELQEQVSLLQQEREHLHASLQTATEQKSQLESDLQHKTEMLNQLTEDLERVQAERDSLPSEKTADTAEELEKLLSKVTCLTEERDQLQEIVEGLRQERNQLKEQLDENMEMAQIERNEQQPLNSELQERSEQVSLLQQEREHLHASLQTATEQKSQLESDLQHKTEMLNQLTEDLERVQAERDSLPSEKTADTAEELEKLLSKVTCLTEERDQLQEIVEGLRQERNQLKEQLDENMEMAQIERNEQQPLNSELQEHSEQVSLLQQEREHLHASLQTATEQKSQLESDLQHKTEMLNQLTEDLERVQAERDSLPSEKTADTGEELEKLLSKVTCLTEERDQLQEIVEGLRQERNQLKEQLDENMEMAQIERNEQQPLNSELQEHSEQVSELQQELNQLTKELESVQAERDGLLSEKMTNNTDSLLSEKTDSQDSAEKFDKLLSQVTCLTEERDQLKIDTQENVEMMIDIQDQLRAEMEKNREQMKTIKLLEHAQMSTQDGLTSEQNGLQLEELQNHIKRLTDDLVSVQAERDHLLSEKTGTQDSTEELEKLQSKVTCLTKERDHLQETLNETSRQHTSFEEKLSEMQQQMKDLEEKLADSELSRSTEDNLGKQVQEQLNQLTKDLECVQAERDCLLSEKTGTQDSAEELEKLLSKVTCLTEERDQLQEIMAGLRQERNQLKEHLEENMEMAQNERNQQQQLTSELQVHNERVSMLEQQIKRLTDDLVSVQAERDHLLSEKTVDTPNSTEELEKLQSKVTCLTKERDHLQETVEETLNETSRQRTSFEEKLSEMQQRMKDLDEKLADSELSRSTEEDSGKQVQEQLNQLTKDLERVQAERDCLLSEKTGTQDSAEELEKLLSNVACLTEERDQLQEIMAGLKQERNQLKEHLEENMEMAQNERNEQQRLNSELQVHNERVSMLEQQIKLLTDDLVSVQAERDHLLSEKTVNTQNSTEELEKLQSKVTCLTKERDHLQEAVEETLNATSQQQTSFEEKLNEMQQQMKDLEEKLADSELSRSTEENSGKQVQEDLERVQAERDCLLSEKTVDAQNSAEGLEKLQSKVTCLTEERDQLQEIMEGLRQERNQLKEHLEENMEMISASQDELKQLQHSKSEQEVQRQQEIQQMKQELSDIGEERSVLQKDLQDKVEMVIKVQASLKQQQLLNTEQQGERQEDQLNKGQQFEEEMQRLKESIRHYKAAAQDTQQALFEDDLIISALKTKLSNLEQKSCHVCNGTAEGLSSRLQDSTLQILDSFKGFQLFIDHCPSDKALSVKRTQHLTTLPKPTAEAYRNVVELTEQSNHTLRDMKQLLKCYALDYKLRFEELIQSDLAVFEELRLQDVLLCRTQAPSYSFKEEDFQAVWEPKFSELLDKRETYLQKMVNLLERLWGNMDAYQSVLSEELGERERFEKEWRAALAHQPLDSSVLDRMLSGELPRRAAVTQSKKLALQGVCDEHKGLVKELELLNDQAVAQLSQAKSKTATLLQVLDSSAPVTTEVDLLAANHQLVLQLQQSEREVKAMHIQIEQLEEEQLKASDRVSSNKQATQLLQTELQDACAQVEDKDRTIRTLKDKLRESEDHARRNVSAVELKECRAQLLKMEVKLTTATSKHEVETQKMNTLLNLKEQSLRSLKETLRESQQEEESFNQGKDLYSKLMHPKGHAVQSSIHTQKAKLEEEVKQLKLKITELESLVNSQQTDIAKWKSRAFKLKVKGKVAGDNPMSPCTSKRHLSPCTPTKRRVPMSPCTPTKRCLPMSSEMSHFLNSPKRLLDSVKDSPKKTSLLNSPKSKFFDSRPGSESLSHCPKQFFDNSNLGTLPEVSCAPTMSDVEVESLEKMDSADGVDNNEWWPLSPKQTETCKTQ